MEEFVFKKKKIILGIIFLWKKKIKVINWYFLIINISDIFIKETYYWFLNGY